MSSPLLLQIEMLAIGVDAATWDVIRPNLNVLPNFRKLID
jgi:predicted AlkP superfamily phosphohydrolase/phosphomutase